MIKKLLRNFSLYKELRTLNRELKFASVKSAYETTSSFESESEKTKCKSQYLFALRCLNLSEQKKTAAEPEKLIHVTGDNPHEDRNDRLLNIFIAVFLPAFLIYNLKELVTDIGSPGGEYKTNINSVKTTKAKFSDVKGIDEMREELEEIVMFLKNPRKYHELGARVPKGVLLTGSPGTGKTLLARAIAGEAGVNFYYSSGSEFEEMFYGLGAKRVRDLFAEAKKHSPCIVFIDEIDCLGMNRNYARFSSGNTQTLNQLLIEMDGFAANDSVIVIGATNFSEILDQALMRSGRFDKTIHIPMPDLKGRTEIYELYLSRVKHEESVTAKILATRSMGMSGAQIKNIVNLAALNCVKQGRTACSLDDFEEVIDRVKIGSTNRRYTMESNELLKTAYHEVGHALISFLTKGEKSLHKVTILPKGMSLGHTSMEPLKEHDIMSQEDVLDIICVALGGRAAEEIMLGEENITSGCSQDLRNATSYSLMSINSGLFSNTYGLLSKNDPRKFGNEQKNKINKKTIEIIESSYLRAKKLLTDNIEILKKISFVLVEKETLTAEEFAKLVKE